MRVALDTNGVYTSQAGTARYIRGLVKGLRQSAPSDITYFEFGWDVENFDYQQPRRALKTLYRELVWFRVVGPRLLAQRNTDVLHSTVGWQANPPRRTKVVATLHDLAVFRHPERFRFWQGWSGRACLSAIRKADRVICISRFVAEEGIHLLGISPSKIDVVYNGCEFHPSESPPPEQKPDFPVPAEFFLFVGSIEPGKNLSLLRAVYQLAEERSHRLPPLLIVGTRWLGVRNEGQPPSGWHYLGRQPDEVLVYLYRRASALIFPSKYEGFGLPVVEAMSLGCPVVCSPVASLQEVGGDAALFCKLQPDAYLDAIKRLSTEIGLREALVENGYRQARQFSWRRCAEETAEVYRSALKS
jgi:glycosyltransferase involved in cell wall biosynthesis